MKRCTKCGRELPESEFYTNVRNEDGLSSWCKDCQIEKIMEYNRQNRAWINMRKREYRKLERQHKIAQREEQIRKIEEEQKARYKANRRCYHAKAKALMEGKVIDPACGDDE